MTYGRPVAKTAVLNFERISLFFSVLGVEAFIALNHKFYSNAFHRRTAQHATAPLSSNCIFFCTAMIADRVNYSRCPDGVSSVAASIWIHVVISSKNLASSS